jgi:predicted nucleotidyltransferase
MAGRSVGVTLDPALTRFAEVLAQRLGASHVLLFGSRATGNQRPDSDYDIIVVAERFRGIHRMERPRGLRSMFYEVGGHAPMDIFCLTPEEFESAKDRVSLIAAVLPDAIDLLAA